MYDVALLIERQLNDLDADQVIALHEGLDDTVRYHLLLPFENSAAVLTSSMGALGSGQIVPVAEPEVLSEIQGQIESAGEAELQASAELLTTRGQQVTATLTDEDPIDALRDLVRATSSSEAIILTESHVVREFLHLDWASRARRALDVPTLHLLEHVPFEGQR